MNESNHGSAEAEASGDNQGKEVPNLLVVDDTVANLQLLTGMLKGEGYKVRPAADGESALRAASSNPPDLILLDINMPLMDGYEVCQHLKQDPELADIPVIFISALSETVDKVKGFQLGAVDYITKPFQFEEVRSRVETHLKICKLQSELSAKNKLLKDKNHKLQELTSLSNNLTRLIIHDLRAPLAGIMGYLELLQINTVGELPDEYREDIDKALAASTQLHELVNSLLDITKLEEAKMPVELRNNDMAEIAQESLNSLESLAEFRELNIAQDFQTQTAYCDRTLTRRVITNLLHNALKHTKLDGKIQIQIRDEHDGTVRVSVRDNGPGIPNEHRDLVFEKFGITQLRNQRHSDSNGLGLAYCKLAVEAQDGKIGVDSPATQGSVFWFTLPKEPAADAHSNSNESE